MVAIYRSEVIQAREAVYAGARPWERTGSVDVEQLVKWALADQMVERFETAGLYQIEAEAAGYSGGGVGGCGVGKLMQIGHLGCRVDTGGVRISDAVHPVAYAVAAALQQVEGAERVRYHARAGTRPTEWVEPEHKARASVWVKPWVEAQVEYEGPGRKGGYCPIIILWDQARRDRGRRLYREWWTALNDLAWVLSAQALGFTVTPPAAPAEPWDGAKASAHPPRGSSQRPQT